jgi:hypothetical protein
MAGRVRQPIDVGSLERWVSKNVPQIEVPLDVKQVGDPFDLPAPLLLPKRTMRLARREAPPC